MPEGSPAPSPSPTVFSKGQAVDGRKRELQVGTLCSILELKRYIWDWRMKAIHGRVVQRNENREQERKQDMLAVSVKRNRDKKRASDREQDRKERSLLFVDEK